jgi:ethanolamine-phosphate cytidylyltransferase
LNSLVPGIGPKPDQRIIYVDGGFDLFSSGHIAFLKQVTALETQRQPSWPKDKGYPPAYVVVGIHSDAEINRRKGINYPIMNIFERGLCVIQCRYVHALVFGAPVQVSSSYLSALESSLGRRKLDATYHGPTSFMPSLSDEASDPYAEAREKGVEVIRTGVHEFQEVNSAAIVKRILDRRAEYEERQRRKGIKGVGEGALRREEMEREAEMEAERRRRAVEGKGERNGEGRNGV